MKVCFFLSLFLIFTLSVSCKLATDDASSGTKSLDNFAAGKTVRTNSCGTNSGVVKVPSSSIIIDGVSCDKQPSNEYCSEVKKYLTSIPQGIQNVFVAMGGQILVTDNANSICTGAWTLDNKSATQYLSKERQSIESCWTMAQSSQSQNVFAVVHKKDVTAIRHGGVRVFGYIMSQLMPRLEKSTLNGSTVYAVNPSLADSTLLKTQKRAVANAFLIDMHKMSQEQNDDMSKNFKLENMSFLLGSRGIAQVKSKINSGATNVLDQIQAIFDNETQITTSTNNQRISQFEDYVFAESFDSFHCEPSDVGDSTRAIMKKYFARTYKVYDVADQVVERFSNTLAVETANIASAPIRPGTSTTDTATQSEVSNTKLSSVQDMLTNLIANWDVQKTISSLQQQQASQYSNSCYGNLCGSGCSSGNCYSGNCGSGTACVGSCCGGCCGGNCSCPGGCCGLS